MTAAARTDRSRRRGCCSASWRAGRARGVSSCRWPVGPSGFGARSAERRGRRADLLGDPPAARDPGRAGGRGARAVRGGAAGLSAQSAGRAEPGRRLGRRGAGRRAGDPSRAVAGVRAGAAGRRADRRRARHAGRGGAGRRARRPGDADPRRPRRLRHRHGADLARAQPVAEPVRLRRDGVLDDGLAGRPQPDAGVAGGAADARRHGRAARARPRARRAHARRGCRAQPRHRSWPHAHGHRGGHRAQRRRGHGRHRHHRLRRPAGAARAAPVRRPPAGPAAAREHAGGRRLPARRRYRRCAWCSPGSSCRIGVLTALIGAPFFVWLVLKTRSELAPDEDRGARLARCSLKAPRGAARPRLRRPCRASSRP